MSDSPTSPTPTPSARKLPSGAGNIWTDIGPVLAFVIVYNVIQRFPEGGGLFAKENAIFWGTGVFMAGVAGAIAWTLSKGRKLPPMLIITGVTATGIP